MKLKEILSYANGDDIYTMIVAGRLYVDMHATPLAEPDRVRVFLNKEMARAYSLITETSSAVPACNYVSVGVGGTVIWDDRQWTIVNLGKNKTTLLSVNEELLELPNNTVDSMVKQGKFKNLNEQTQPNSNAIVQEFFSKASPDDFRVANHRYTIIRPCLQGCSPKEAKLPSRTVRRWLKKWRDAEQTYGCGYLGLLPREQGKGNRKRKLPENIISLMEEFIANDYETLKQKPKYEVYGALVRACEKRGIAPPSYKSFVKKVNLRPQREQTMKRQGRRAAYTHEPFYRELTLTTPRHGDRPFEIGHIDHTQLDIELVCSQTGRNLGRPWATFLTDAFCRRLLAVYLTFDAPSYRSCMMILRECVHRYNRLPQIIVVDGGKDFESTYFETLLARYECIKKMRPSSKARFGSVCERLFGTTNTRFIHNLVGNTQIMLNVRQVTKSVNPQKHARWTLGSLYQRLCEWAYEIYDTIEHPALHESPREAFDKKLQECGQRSHRFIPYDEDLRIATLPTTKKGTAKVVPHLGVKIRYIWYWSNFFLDPEVENTQVPVRFDPFDAATAYAFVKGRWVSCVSEHHAQFSGRSWQEIMLASEELCIQNRRHNRQFVVTARKLADFLASLEAEEVLLEQRLKDQQIKTVHAAIEGHHGNKTITFGSSIADEQEKPVSTPSKSDEKLVIYEDY